MARGINKVILIGNLGRDPEVRHRPSGDAVATVSVATSESWRDRETGEQHERTEWHRVVFFRRLAEVVGDYLHKGSKIYVEGKLRTRQWERDGQKRYTTEVVAEELQMLDGRGGSGGGGGGGGGDTGYGDNRSSYGNASQQAPAASGASNSGPPSDDFDDDIPF